MNRKLLVKNVSALLLLCFAVFAQAQDSIRVTLKTNVRKDMIQLRWAVNSPAAWYYTNKNGVNIERYTLMRNGTILSAPEKKVLTATPLRPHPLNDWQQIATTNNYAAIIAQALYGKTFEVSGGETGIGKVIALSQEQQQRYSMSMYAAELSFPAALFAGWGYEDKTAVKGERYLYRIIPVCNNPKKPIEMGSAYVSIDDYENLPQPQEVSAVFGNSSVLITWNYQLLLNYYSSYFLERTEDGKTFRRLSATPLTNITGGNRMFYTDSIVNNKTYYYRVIGLTPFTEEGPASDTIQGMGKSKLVYTPQITQVMPDDKGNLNVSWEFDKAGDKDLSSFELQRSNTSNGVFATVISGISPESRSVVYNTPQAENDLRIAAIPKEGEPSYSFPRLVQMADTIPPETPKGLEGSVDTTGVVHLKWMANTEPDLLGYRIHRGQTKGEELVPLNDAAIKATEFKDSVNIDNLNAKVYYSVTALDKRYNQSGKSTVIEITKPVMINPAPPFISKCEATDKGIRLEWTTGKDETLQAYFIYRGEKTMEHTVLIKEIKNPQTKVYLDSTVTEGVVYKYEVESVNQGKLHSLPSPSVFVKAKNKTANAFIKDFTGKRTEKGIVLKWQHSLTNIKSISIYRKEGETAFSLWKEVDVWDKEVTDATAKRNIPYQYLLVIRGQYGKPVNAQIKVD
jgi:uncharacterized protein